MDVNYTNYLKIDQDHGRFREIIRGRIRRDMRKFISKGEMIGRVGKDHISIPIPQIDIPRFRFGQKSTGGVGQGDGEEGSVLGPGSEQPGTGKAGESSADHILEVDVSFAELAQILGEELQLPNIQPRGREKIEAIKDRYSGVRKVGPNSLRHFKRTYREALKRQIISRSYNLQTPIIIPIKSDMRYRSWKEIKKPESNAVIIYMMDVSGSMGDEQKEIVRIESFWIDTWIKFQYKGVESRYIIHDAKAKEVDRETFFHTKESGGTMISSAYEQCAAIIATDYAAVEWNIYPFHFSDGDNWSIEDTQKCMKLMEEAILPFSNMFGYGQVESPYGSGQFIKDLRDRFHANESIILSDIKNKEAIYDSIRDFLGKGK